jgi:hypothetical protein
MPHERGIIAKNGQTCGAVGSPVLVSWSGEKGLALSILVQKCERLFGPQWNGAAPGERSSGCQGQGNSISLLQRRDRGVG